MQRARQGGQVLTSCRNVFATSDSKGLSVAMTEPALMCRGAKRPRPSPAASWTVQHINLLLYTLLMLPIGATAQCKQSIRYQWL